jgi:hypothetical protein
MAVLPILPLLRRVRAEENERARSAGPARGRVADAHRRRPTGARRDRLIGRFAQGLMFWFRWKMLSGSYRCLTSRNRFQFGPNAADTALPSARSSALR